MPGSRHPISLTEWFGRRGEALLGSPWLTTGVPRDDHDSAILDTVLLHGVAVQHAPPVRGALGFSYTVGASWVGCPELIIFAVPPWVSHALLTRLSEVTRDRGEPFQHGDQVVGLLQDRIPVKFVEVLDPNPYVSAANRLFRWAEDVSVDALQVVFPDSDGLWSWEPGSGVAEVPVLGFVPQDGEGVLIDLAGGN